MMNGRGKSDSSEVPTKSPNNAEGPAAEAMEGRGLAKGNPPQRNAFRTQGREDALSALERVRQAASRDRKQQFTALFHHIYDVKRLRAAFLAIKKDAAAGVDGETWEHYGENLEVNRSTFRISPIDSSEEPTGQGLYAGFTFRRWVSRVSFGHWVFPRWKTRSSSVPPSRC